METVGTAHLKNSLSSYLHKVKKGSRFMVTDRGKPVAKLVPLLEESGESQEEILAHLVAAGVVRPPVDKKRREITTPRIKLSGITIQEILDEERNSW